MLKRRRAHPLLAAAGLILASRAAAQGVCYAPIDTDFTAAESDNRLEFLFGPDAVVGGEIGGQTEIRGGFVMRYRQGEISAEDIRYSRDSLIEIVGTVELRSPELRVRGENAEFDRDSEVISVGEAVLDLTGENQAHASANRIIVRPDRTISLSELDFTTCPEDDIDWELVARTLEIDRDAGFGKARGVVFRFKGVPIIYLPVMSFPVDDRRKSGFLTPAIAERDRTGFDLTVPYYLNLAPNYDLLLSPRYMEDRGTQIGSHFRYLLPDGFGDLDIEYLPEDRSLDRERLFANFEHASRFGRRVELHADIENVSDSAYFEDLGDNLGTISQTHLDRFVDIAYYAPRWSVVSRVKEYQTIDTQIAPTDLPYERQPQMLFAGSWGDGLLNFESYAETVRFDRDIGETGWRFDSTQELALRFDRSGFYVTPAIAYRQTNYSLERGPTTSARSLSRGLPVTSVDSGLRFERQAGRSRSWIQTIEPRLLYVHIPYEDQSELPVFDTILPDFNLIQLFHKYQFVGGDRVADTNRISFGLTTRLIESDSGRERLSATLGQSRFREPRRVLLPDETDVDSTRSNYVARLDIAVGDYWNLDLGYQWNGETEESVRTETRFEFRPAPDRLFGIGYRMREGLLEQGDLAMIWPVGERWRLIGQYSYSLLENKALERLTGIEYEACCWRIRLTSQHYIVRSTGQTDSTISIQLELKGLGGRGASPEELLGRGILGPPRFDQDAD